MAAPDWQFLGPAGAGSLGNPRRRGRGGKPRRFAARLVITEVDGTAFDGVGQGVTGEVAGVLLPVGGVVAGLAGWAWVTGWQAGKGRAGQMRLIRCTVLVTAVVLAGTGTAAGATTSLPAVQGSALALARHDTSAGGGRRSCNKVVATIGVGLWPGRVAVDPKTDMIYVADSGAGTVSVISGRSRMVTATIRVGSRPYGIAVDPVTDMIYVANSGSGSVSVISGRTNAVTATISGLSGSPQDIAVDPVTDTIYQVTFNDDADTPVSVISGQTNTVTAAVGSIFQPVGVAVDPATNTAYVADLGRDTVPVISGRTNTVTATIGPVGTWPNSIAVNPVTHAGYTTDWMSGTVSVFSGRTGKVTAKVRVGAGPEAVAVNPATNLIYATSTGPEAGRGPGTVWVISGRTSKVTGTIRVGHSPVGIAVDPLTSTAYVSNLNDDTVSVLALCPKSGSTRTYAPPDVRRSMTSAGSAQLKGSARRAGSPRVPGSPGIYVVGQSFLSGVSCPRASFCVAVGYLPSAKFWNGTVWRPMASPSPGTGAQLTAVSCPSRASCVAIGTDGAPGPVTEAWNGRRWRVLPPVTVPAQATLTAVSCARSAACIAVGHGQTTFAADGALAERWNGTAWTRLATAPPPGGALSSSFAGVSCANATSCLAVGQYTTATAAGPLAESWNGRSWTLLTPAPGIQSITAVSCPAAGACMTVGDSSQVPGEPAADWWTGTTWRQLDPTVPVGPQGEADAALSSVSCASASNCIAVGLGGSYVSPDQTLAEHWNGATWTTTGIANPAGGQRPAMDAISCTRSGDCMAVGNPADSSGPVAASAWWNGRRWQGRRTYQADALNGISCPASTRCVAVGSYVDASGDTAPLAENWNGTTWRPVFPPGLGPLTSISCATAAFCVALGGPTGAMAWNGVRWRQMNIPGASSGSLTSISCVTAAFCLAISDPLGSELWNGRNWTAKDTAQTPPEYYIGALHSVSCASASYCVAIGYLQGEFQPAPPNIGIESVWNGRQWAATGGPVNSGSAVVTCTRRFGCTALGAQIYLQRFGRPWYPHAAPDVGGLGRISCASATLCMAVGSISTSDGIRDVADMWNGHIWQATTTLAPAIVMDGVSCPQNRRCVAVGTASNIAAAELWNGATWQHMTTPNP